ncbi:MAG TPA: NAD-dependent epimerase/dehydratase family protein [Candidatus Acidoferrales bacterium]|nr:NAD-dependent epimerase/dehydratase family protein [Candidatus Acidoferrales bacterium]
MRILVTGGAGFIASYVADAYIAAGHDVAILDDLSRGSTKNMNPQARFYKGDVRDRDFVERVFREEQPEVVNHHAAQMDVRRGVREPVFDASVNILGSINLLDTCVAHKVRRVVYISTAGAAYGEPKEMPVPEDYPINPVTPYGISKHTVEHYLFTYRVLYDLSYVVLRYGNVYGPRQSSKGEAGVFAIFCEQMLAGVRPVIYGDGGKLRDYVYSEDVARANVLALERGTGEIFNIANGVPTKDYEVFRMVRDGLGLHGLEPDYVPKRPGEIDRIYLDISKAQRLLGWKPGVSLEEGSRRTVAYFKKTYCENRSSVTTRDPANLVNQS